MDELISIIQQRRAQLDITTNSTRLKHKSELIEQERKRVQRENWILRVVKTIKVPALEQKKIIIQTILKLMNFFKPMTTHIDNIQQSNFTQSIINLFVQFYNKFEDMDLTHIRTIIRPNNSYIIVDLIKSMIDLSRKEFKIYIQEHFKQTMSTTKLDSRPLLKPKVKTQGKNSKPLLQQQQTSVQQDQIHTDVYKKIQTALFQKYNKTIDNFSMAASYEKFNELYFDLMYLNQKNSHRIQKYMDSCFGAKRHINYDASGLYTLEEIKNIKKERQQRAISRIGDLKELKDKCTGQQLKEFFKMKVQLHQSINSFPLFKKQETIQKWFPIACIKNGDKLHPYNIMVEINGIYYSQTQFQEKYNKKLKNYMKQLLMEDFNTKCLYSPQDQEMIAFNKKLFLDYNQIKLNQLLIKQTPKVYKWETEAEKEKKEKQKMFPPIHSSYNLELDTRCNKSKSETKLPDTSVLLYSQKGIGLKQILQKRLNYSSFVKDMTVPNRKINSVISNILKSRQYQFK